MGMGEYYYVFGHLKGTTDEGEYIVADDIEAETKTEAIKIARKRYPKWTIVSALSPEEIYNNISPYNEIELWKDRHEYENRMNKRSIPNFMKL